MSNSAKSRAEEQFAASQKKAKQALQEKDTAGTERSEKTARLNWVIWSELQTSKSCKAKSLQ